MDDFIPTRVSKLKKNATVNFVSVNYEGRRKKRKADSVNQTNPKKEKNEPDPLKAENAMEAKKQQEREMKRMRYEVMKFGMTGFGKAKALKAKTDLLVSLGAKPPKRKAQNYKDLIVQRIKQKKKVKKQKERASGLSKSITRHKKPTLVKKKGKDDILDVYGKVEEKRTKKAKH